MAILCNTTSLVQGGNDSAGLLKFGKLYLIIVIKDYMCTQDPLCNVQGSARESIDGSVIKCKDSDGLAAVHFLGEPALAEEIIKASKLRVLCKDPGDVEGRGS